MELQNVNSFLIKSELKNFKGLLVNPGVFTAYLAKNGYYIHTRKIKFSAQSLKKTESISLFF